MSTPARDHILARIHSALGCSSATPGTCADLEQRMAAPPLGPLPAIDGDPVRYFISKAASNGMTVDSIESLQSLVPAVAKLLLETDTKANISIAPALADLQWPEDWQVNIGAGRYQEHLSVTLASAGIAETGSVIFKSGPSSPASLNFLPDIHVVVLKASDIVAHLEDVWAHFRAHAEGWPRAINVIAGPSRTADVGGIIVRPAHGPKAVHLFLLSND